MCSSVTGTARVKYAERLHAFHATVGVVGSLYVCILEHTVGSIYHIVTAATSKPYNAHRSKAVTLNPCTYSYLTCNVLPSFDRIMNQLNYHNLFN